MTLVDRSILVNPYLGSRPAPDLLVGAPYALDASGNVGGAAYVLAGVPVQPRRTARRRSGRDPASERPGAARESDRSSLQNLAQLTLALVPGTGSCIRKWPCCRCYEPARQMLWVIGIDTTQSYPYRR